MDAVKELKHKGKTIEIYADENPTSPRENDNLGTILYLKGSRYILGDKAMTREEIDAIVVFKDVVVLPVYAYIHSGIAMNTTGFSCPWDSGQSGVIYAERSKILENFRAKRLTPALRAKVEKILQGEVEEYSKYLGGEVYGFIVKDANGEEVDSCWGFIGLEYAIEAAKEAC